MGDSPGPRIDAAVLAAGQGRRMGMPKAELVVDGARLVDRAVAAARQAGCSRVFAVVQQGTEVADARVVVNAEPARGQRSSLALVLAAAEHEAPVPEAIALLLIDTPGIGAGSVAPVLAAWEPGRICVGSYGGQRAHPIVMAPRLWRLALAQAGPDQGARRFLASRPDLVDEIPVPGDPFDLDSPEDLERWHSRQVNRMHSGA